jgi:nitroimidazol reductase NimA-like FMN-containing flavoprotein (pyridoxamine 5'-phosphate oxidase superfamily)
MSSERASEVLVRCSNGVLACMGDEDYPYAVPLNYVWFDGRIYFHSAKAGHKIDAIIKTRGVFCRYRRG